MFPIKDQEEYLSWKMVDPGRDNPLAFEKGCGVLQVPAGLGSAQTLQGCVVTRQPGVKQLQVHVWSAIWRAASP